MFQALLVDLGNVLVRFDHGRTLRAVSAAAGEADPERLRPALFGPLERELDCGRLGTLDFFRAVERAAGIRRLPDEVWIPAWRDIFEPIPSALALLSLVRRPVRTCLVSNTNALHWEGVLAVCDVNRRVDALALSFEVGSVKPDTAIFDRALDLAGAGPEDAVFVDDKPEFVEAARRLGIDAFLASTPSALEEGLRSRDLLGGPPRPQRMVRS
jgi:putative hydrolase of the HAD superfamily